MSESLPRPLASYVDHTLLRPEATTAAIERLAEEAAEHRFAAVCVPPCHVAVAVRRLALTPVQVATVIAFPLGYADPAARIAESRAAIDAGATELDTVINLGWLKGGEDGRVLDDLAGWVEGVASAAGHEPVVTKVILETALLDDEEKVRAARLAVEAGADFVKTSTGFGPGGATVDDVRLLAETVGGRARVKASGGIRDRTAALAMIEAGADRLGTSSGVAIVGG